MNMSIVLELKTNNKNDDSNVIIKKKINTSNVIKKVI